MSQRQSTLIRNEYAFKTLKLWNSFVFVWWTFKLSLDALYLWMQAKKKTNVLLLNAQLRAVQQSCFSFKALSMKQEIPRIRISIRIRIRIKMRIKMRIDFIVDFQHINWLYRKSLLQFSMVGFKFYGLPQRNNDSIANHTNWRTIKCRPKCTSFDKTENAQKA